MIQFEWKPITEIPTEHYEGNSAISPRYLVRCGNDEYGLPILGYAHYSFATNKWMNCYDATSRGVWVVEKWTDIKL